MKHHLSARLRSLGRILFPSYPYRPEELRHRAIFLHIPKTAGTSFLIALGANGQGRRHLSWRHYRDADPRRFRRFYKFAVVREPLDRLQSLYGYLRAGGNGFPGDGLHYREILRRHPTFDDFVQNFLSGETLARDPLFGAQTSFLCDLGNRIQVDSILRFETLGRDYADLRSRLPRLPADLPGTNRSPDAASRPAPSAETRQRIRRIYASDYEVFYPGVR